MDSIFYLLSQGSYGSCFHRADIKLLKVNYDICEIASYKVREEEKLPVSGNLKKKTS